MIHQYTSEYPTDVTVDPQVIDFFKNFYSVSDTPDAHEEYAREFADDATFILASKVSHGHAEILAARQGMWSTVNSRKHTPVRVFPFGSNGKEFMLYGTVDYTFKNGKDASKNWAARAEFVSVDERLKFKFYQVYLDTAAQQ